MSPGPSSIGRCATRLRSAGDLPILASNKPLFSITLVLALLPASGVSHAINMPPPEVINYLIIKLLMAVGGVLGLLTLGASALLARAPRKLMVKKIAAVYFSLYAFSAISLVVALESTPRFSYSSRFNTACEAVSWIMPLLSVALMVYAYVGSRSAKQPDSPAS